MLNVDIVLHVPEIAWTYEVRRRCGPSWPGGKIGVLRLGEALLSCKSPYGAGMMSAGSTSAHTIDMTGVRSWCALDNPKPVHSASRFSAVSVNSICTVDSNHVAVGHMLGVMVFASSGGYRGTPLELWLGRSVIDLAYVGNGILWLVTSHQLAYEWNIRTGDVGQICQEHLVYCVSGPRGLAGVTCGTWPSKSAIPTKCVCIRQSSVLVAALHADGYVCTFDAETFVINHIFDSNARNCQLNVIGDIVCMKGVLWCRGRRRGKCPDDSRAVTHDGSVILVSRSQCPVSHIHDPLPHGWD